MFKGTVLNHANQWRVSHIKLHKQSLSLFNLLKIVKLICLKRNKIFLNLLLFK